MAVVVSNSSSSSRRVIILTTVLILVVVLLININYSIDISPSMSSSSSYSSIITSAINKSSSNLRFKKEISSAISKSSSNLRLKNDGGTVTATLFQMDSKFTDNDDANATTPPKKRGKLRPSRRDRGDTAEKDLARARAAIRLHTNLTQFLNDDPADHRFSNIYRNPSAFYRSYKEMEKRFKVYVYEEGDPPIVHSGPCKDIYTTEGRFINEMERSSSGVGGLGLGLRVRGIGISRFRTWNPQRAHVFFMPFSVTSMVEYLYKPLTYDLSPLRNFVSDYVRVISDKYPFWNSTNGANHFMLACHDWGPHASQGNQLLYNTSIRVLCNANSSEGFNPQKDVTLPEINLKSGKLHPKLLQLPPISDCDRPHLAFFAGGLHGPIRSILLDHWKGRDQDLLVYEYLPPLSLPSGGGTGSNRSSSIDDYYTYMLNSKFCLCPSGYEVASPRIVEAIYAKCVPVILSKNYVLPFSDVLNWETFSLIVDVEDIPRLKDVLLNVGEDHYRKLVQGVKAVKKHFMLNAQPKRFDAFHMTLHSIWLRRLNFKLN